jgi:tRNA-dihydrouridine synthase
MDFLGNKLYLAPLAGITDTVFRRICKENGADVVMSEMVSAEGLFYKSKLTERLLRFDNCERPVGIQLLAQNPITWHMRQILCRKNISRILSTSIPVVLRQRL